MSVDDRRARYPVRIDPLIQQGATLTANDEDTAGQFGGSVALSAELGQPFRWQAGYFAESVREVHTLTAYIGGQREHHRDPTVQESWETLRR